LVTEQEPEQPKVPTSWCLGIVYDCSTNYLRVCDASSKQIECWGQFAHYNIALNSLKIVSRYLDYYWFLYF
jgi:hypothetical protein